MSLMKQSNDFHVPSNLHILSFISNIYYKSKNAWPARIINLPVFLSSYLSLNFLLVDLINELRTADYIVSIGISFASTCVPMQVMNKYFSTLTDLTEALVYVEDPYHILLIYYIIIFYC